MTHFPKILVAGLLGFSIGWLARGIGKEKVALPQSLLATPSSQTGSVVYAAKASGVPEGPESSSIHSKDQLTKKLTAVFHLTNDNERLAGFMRLVEGLSLEELSLVTEAIFTADREGLQSTPEWTWLLQQWELKGGRAGMDKVMSEYGAGHNLSFMTKEILRGWSENNVREATGWLNDHPDTPDWDGCLSSIIKGAALKDLNLATSAAIQSISKDQGGLRDNVAKALSETATRQGGIAGLSSWFSNLPDTAESLSFRTTAMEHVAFRLQHASIEQGMEFLNQSADKPWRNDRAYIEMMRKVSETDPKRALEWIQTLPPSTTSKTWPGAENAFSNWCKMNPDAASQCCMTNLKRYSPLSFAADQAGDKLLGNFA